MVFRVFEGDAEARGGSGRGGHGGGPVLRPEARARVGDGLLHLQGVPSALHHRVRPAVHLQPGEQRVDRSCLPLHGQPLFSSSSKADFFPPDLV